MENPRIGSCSREAQKDNIQEQRTIDFLKDITNSLEKAELSPRQLKTIGEFLMEYQFGEEHNDEQMVFNEKDLRKFMFLGWYIYAKLSESQVASDKANIQQHKCEGCQHYVPDAEGLFRRSFLCRRCFNVWSKYGKGCWIPKDVKAYCANCCAPASRNFEFREEDWRMSAHLCGVCSLDDLYGTPN